MARAHIALGSNLGDRLATLRAAVVALAEIGHVVARSSAWETRAVGPPPDYLNGCVALETTLAPEALLAALLAIEARLGRVRDGERNQPRTLDLDLVLYEDRVVDTERLRLPHPRLAERAFVLAPLAEIAPDAIHPLLHCTIRELAARALAAAPDAGVRRLDEIL